MDAKKEEEEKKKNHNKGEYLQNTRCNQSNMTQDASLEHTGGKSEMHDMHLILFTGNQTTIQYNWFLKNARSCWCLIIITLFKMDQSTNYLIRLINYKLIDFLLEK